MEENNYKPQIPDVLEAIFDVAYRECFKFCVNRKN